MRFFSAIASFALLGSSFALPIEERQSTAPGLATYWGQPGTSSSRLTPVCDDPSYNTVILAFLVDIFGPGGWPTLRIAQYGPSQAQLDAGASGLINASDLPGAIGRCKANGKKVLLSIGGQTGTTKFTAERYAKAAATNIFNLFLGGSNSTTAPIRPFGTTILDGIDIDSENQQPAYWDVFVNELRAKMRADSARQYIITAAPQCPRNLGTVAGDQSIPDKVLKLVDHVFVQFYNNSPNLCNHGQSQFIDRLKAWSTAVSPAKVWVGAPASSDSAGNGYVSASALATEIKSVKALKLANFGGYMLWKSESAILNNNYQKSVRTALNTN